MRNPICSLLVAFLSSTLAGVSAADYATEVLADAPVGYWRLNETSGTVAIDASGNGINGTYSGVVLGVEGTGCGSPELAATFDDGTDRVTVNQSPPLYVEYVTMEAWVLWCGDNGIQQRVVERSWGGPTLAEYGLSARSNGLVQVEVMTTGAGGKAAQSVTALSPSVWTHLAATYDGATISIYINGLLDHSEPAVGGVIDNDNKHLGIGNQASRDRPWNGTLDEVAVYDHALSATRIWGHFRQCSPPAAPECPAQADRKIYWTDYGTDKIQRANLDGTSAEDLVTGLGLPRHILISGGRMYWADDSANMVQRASLDGTGLEDLVVGLDNPYGIAWGPGSADVSSVPGESAPTQLGSLRPSYPNPSTTDVWIPFDLPHPMRARLTIYDAGGRAVTTLVDDDMAQGQHVIRWDARVDGGDRVSSGTYFVRLESSGRTASARVVLIR